MTCVYNPVFYWSTFQSEDLKTASDIISMFEIYQGISCMIFYNIIYDEIYNIERYYTIIITVIYNFLRSISLYVVCVLIEIRFISISIHNFSTFNCSKKNSYFTFMNENDYDFNLVLKNDYDFNFI